MDTHQGFLSNFNYPVKKRVVRRVPQNTLGLKKKIDNDEDQSHLELQQLNYSESPSDIQRKTSKAQEVKPQARMRLSSKINKILVTNSSKDSSKKDLDTLVGCSDDLLTEARQKELPSSDSLSFPDSVDISEPKSAGVDTEIYTDDDSFAEEKSQRPGVSKPKDTTPCRKPASDTFIGNSEDIQEDSEEKSQRPGVSKPKDTTPCRKPASDTFIGNSEDIAKKYRGEGKNDYDSEDSEEEVIPVYDSEEEVSMNNLQPPVPSKSFYNCSRSSSSTVNNFFNNPPSLKDDRMAVRHSDILRFKQQNQERLHIPIIDENFGEEDVSMLSARQENEAKQKDKITEDESMLSLEQERLGEHIEIGPTDESNNVEDDDVVDLTINESPPRQARVHPSRSNEVLRSSHNTPGTIKAQISTTPRSGRKNVTNINIKFDLKISIRDGNASDTSSSAHSSPKSSPRRLTESQSIPTSANSKNKNTRTNKQAGTPNNLMVPMLKNTEEPKTPVKEEIMIDDDLQKMLSDLYGDSWKTPQLLKSCKSKRVRENLRKSLHANNFESFVRHLPSDLESTRVNYSNSDEKESEEEKFIKPTAPISGKKTSVKKNTAKQRSQSNTDSESDVATPKSQKSVHRSISKATPVSTPKYLEICDPDSSSSSEASEDEDFNPNDTWNASSDEEYEKESDRIKKRQTIRQSVLVGELTFVRDQSDVEQHKLEQLLERYEFTKPPQIGSAKKSKRKLFTHLQYEEEEIEDSSPKIIEEKENQVPQEFKWPSPRKDIKKAETASPIIRKTPVKTKSSQKDIQKRFGPLSFLKSLDAESNRSLCDSEALYYRNHYKAKKQELAEKLFQLYNQKIFNSELTNVPMKWNKKLLNTAGRCNNSRRNGIRQSALELSDKVLTSADRLRCTLIHEMCHAAAWVLNGENGHGVVWKRWAAKANATFPELPKISVCHDYVIEYRYTYLCINCRAQSKTHSKSRKVDEVQCSICKGSIKLFENKRNAAGEIEMIPVEKKAATVFAKFVKLKFKEVKRPNMTHKEVMQILSTQFKSLSVEEKASL